MKVYFIGAGPGASDLITIRGAEILARVPLVLYAGSLVPPAVLTHCRLDAEIVNSAELNLDQQMEYFQRARSVGYDVARVHSGDPSIYGATAEQMRRLKQLGIDYEVVPGVSSFTAAAACVKTELTKPEVSQTIILTRSDGRASVVPPEESLGKLAAHGATMSIFLSGQYLKETITELLEHYPEETPAAIVYRATWPDERSHMSTLGRMLQEINPVEWKLTTVLLVGQALNNETGVDSRLYAADYSHKFRNTHTSREN
jgi:precorrin-4/cobalt-precorrin-4 C11-methyltransferase